MRKSIDDNSAFCEFCGQPVVAVEQPAPPVPPMPPMVPAPKKSKKPLIIGVAAALVAVTAGIGGNGLNLPVSRFAGWCAQSMAGGLGAPRDAHELVHRLLMRRLAITGF